MTYRFTARTARTEIDPDGYFTEAALAERVDGSGFILMFMAGEDDPDDQEIALGMDTHCLVTAGQGTAYGCVREAVLAGNVLHVSLDPGALDDLRLEDSEIEAVIEAPAEDIVQFREVLAQVLNYGRADAVPSRLAV
ncbi:Imm10 family immunity protein [Streptomyces drozdowiczii]|uniref:Imm10 family immunity protein n=1 Tax=Streptomyces drozdowiczii TaxID=202862 RepID=A0ABY6PZ17_9ACTN|nr:Imm10 family immunity protein [Streptomyces drozdowiczii]MCX0242685.1 Imm10 family immunity protein [Streptomyces drozdowiczii]UZK57295.1 Imm10 family immunity protein [Streptomyces drozdowiczii]